MSSSSAAEDILSQQENAAMHLGINNMLDDVIEGPVLVGLNLVKN
jgi:hypothetical protein